MDKSVLCKTALLPPSCSPRHAESLVTTHRGHSLSQSSSPWCPNPCIWAGIQHASQDNTPDGQREAVRAHPCALPPWAMPAPPPVPGGQSAVDGAIRSMHYALCLAQHPCLPRGQRAIGWPALHPALRGTLRPPWRPAWHLTRVPAGHQDSQRG
jgi:hypothetical protein